MMRALVFLLATLSCIPMAGAAETNTVLWISLDGFRYDYPERGELPFFKKVLTEGAWSKRLKPVFPSITFPSHLSEATGVPVSGHGIPANTFYDVATKQTLRFPWQASLLKAEPIWLTAPRQGVRTAVGDWPLAHQQEGEVRSDYFGPKFDPALSDAARLEQLSAWYRDDTGAKPLRLLMGYITATDAVGHREGPDSPAVDAKIAETDALLAKTVERFREKWAATAGEKDALYVILSTDHGMAKVTNFMNFERILPSPLPDGVQVASGGTIANIHLSEIADEKERGKLLEEYLALLSTRTEMDVFAAKDLPEKWSYNHPGRTGDIVCVLKPGWVFNNQFKAPVFTPQDVQGPKGMHGYDVAVCPEMHGFLGVLRFPEPLGGKDLGTVDALQLHPTVARLLDIQPAEGAKASAVEF